MLRVMGSGADCIEQSDKLGIGLAIDFLEFEKDKIFRVISEKFLDDGRGEKMSRAIDAIEGLGFVSRENRRQLVEIPDHHDLDAAEREKVLARVAQKGVDTVEQIRANHRDFIKDKRLELSIEFVVTLCFAFFGGFLSRDADRKFKKTVDGFAGDIHSGDAGGGNDSEIFFGLLTEIL